MVESPKHNVILATQPLEQVSNLVRAWRDRGRALRADRRIRHIHYFKNQGGAAGASLIHPHSQIVALPIVTTKETNRIKIAREYFVRHQVSIFHSMAESELKQNVRVVDENDEFVAIVPYAAICPYELLVLPKQGTAHFEDASDEQMLQFSQILHRVLQRLDCVLGEPSFNMLIRTAPFWSRQAYDYEKFFSWHCSIYPRAGAGAMAGFEFGSGIFSNSHLPEANAEELRSS